MKISRLLRVSINFIPCEVQEDVQKASFISTSTAFKQTILPIVIAGLDRPVSYHHIAYVVAGLDRPHGSTDHMTEDNMLF